MADVAPLDNRFPPQIKYIVGNEAAERFSYYGMTAILTLVMVTNFGFGESEAESLYHLFSAAVYFLPLLGAFLADRYWGKYETIIRLSFVYVAGHAVLAAFETRTGLYVGLGLIALGAGGIKPCVSAHVGDQFTQRNKHLLGKVFSAFYWSINLGSLASTLLTPQLRQHFGASVAFAVPGILMALALFVFWLGRRYYRVVPPTGARPDTPARVLWSLLRHGRAATAERFGAVRLEEALAVARVAKILAPVMFFWAMFFQTGSSWVILTTQLDLHGFLAADQLQAANPALVMAMIPLFTVIIYPALKRRGISTMPLHRMTVGMFVTAASFLPVAALQWLVDNGSQPSALWILVPYFILTAGEIMVSITGLEFAYTQAPASVKSTVQSVWLLTFGFGNLLTAAIIQLNPFDGAWRFAMWTVLMSVVAILFALFARSYKMVEYVDDRD